MGQRKGFKHSEESIKRMRGRTPWNKGIKSWVKPWLGKKRSPETIEKIKLKKIGIRVSPQTEFKKGNLPPLHKKDCKCFRCGGKGYSIPKGNTPWNKGQPFLQIRGENHHNWKGGNTSVNRKVRSSLEYKLWRTAVFQRDKFTCVWCGNNKSGTLQADHIKPFAFYPELRFAIDNGRTLCKECHKTTDTYLRNKK